MATIEQLSAALTKADAAGNVADAKSFADEIRRMRSTPESSIMDDIKQGAGNLAAGAVRGAGSIGNTLLSAGDAFQRLSPSNIIGNALQGKPNDVLSQVSQAYKERAQGMDSGIETMGAQPESLMFKGGKLAGEIAGTAGTGGALANGLGRAGIMSPALLSSIRSGGMVADGAGIGTRMLGGAITGGASTALIDPEHALQGAALGGALPPVLMGVGKLGGAVGNVFKGKEMPQSIQDAVASARDLGYVIPPSQARPTLLNRALEGFSGKITTAQNASAMNAEVTNELAKKAIGATELSPSGLAQVRSMANKAYDDLGKSAPFQADKSFAAALDNAGASTESLRKNFPELVNGKVDDLIQGLKSRGEFEAQPTIEAIKQFRANASSNRISTDPANIALGKAQSKIAGALEDLIDRNLQSAGNADLLSNYRAARQTLAKTYDVEKALNPASGNIDANKLSQALKRGRPLSDELKQIAQFASTFPKANQTVERMGSLPQVSPLDFGALGAMSAATANPALMAGVIARPLARKAVLSKFIQDGLLNNSSASQSIGQLGNSQLSQGLLDAAGSTSPMLLSGLLQQFNRP